MRRYASTRAASIQPRKRQIFPGAQGFNAPEGHGVSPNEVGEGCRTRRGGLHAARVTRTTQKPGRASFLLETFRQIYGAPVTNPPCTLGVCERAFDVAKNKHSHRGRPKARGTRAEAEGNEASEGCIRATKPGNGWHRSRWSKGGPCRERA